MYGCSPIHSISYATIAVISQQSSIHGNCWCQALPGDRGPSSSVRSTESPSAAQSALTPVQRPPLRRLLSLPASGALSVYSHTIGTGRDLRRPVFKTGYSDGPSNSAGGRSWGSEAEGIHSCPKDRPIHQPRRTGRRRGGGTSGLERVGSKNENS